MMTDSTADLLERLVDEFASRCREGDAPCIDEYAAKYPEHAARIEELLSAVAMMEHLRGAERASRVAAASKPSPAEPPRQIGDFRILREIGRGGMGVVYEAQQQSLARQVAVKILPEHANSPQKHLDRFRREAQMAARLHHTNIVPIFGVGEEAGLHYYVMPLVRGVGLDEIIREWTSGGQAGRDIRGVARELTARKFGPSPLPAQGAGLLAAAGD